MIRTEVQIRKELERALGKKVPGAVWEMLCEDRYVKEVVDGTACLADLEKRARQLLKISAGGSTGAESPAFLGVRRQKRGKAIPSRQEAISVLVADLARARPDVREFRQVVLENQVILWKDIGNWLESQRPLSARYAIVKVPTNSKLVLKEGHWAVDRPWPKDLKIEELPSLEVLLYMMPDHDCVGSVPVGRDGPLQRLLRLSRSLSEDYGWEQAQATVFLLADCVPVVSLFRATASFNLQHSTLSRITMTIDPITTPRELAAKYGKFRCQVLNQRTGSEGRRRKRVRTIGEKHAQLATFLVRNDPLDRTKMTTWNRQFPQWEYSRYSNFSRDARVAKERLLHQLDLNLRSLVNPPANQWSSLHSGTRTEGAVVPEAAHENNRLSERPRGSSEKEKGGFDGL